MRSFGERTVNLMALQPSDWIDLVGATNVDMRIKIQL